jgi:hypothetical protein
MHDEVPRGLFRTNYEDSVVSSAIDEMNNTTSTIKHRAPLFMGVRSNTGCFLSLRYTKEEKIQPVEKQGRNS